MLRIKVRERSKSEVKVVALSGAPPEELYDSKRGA